MTGIEVKELRRQLDMQPHGLAEMLGLHVATIYRWESHGRKVIRMEPLQQRLLEALKERLHHASAKRIRDARGEIRKKLLVGGALPALGVVLAWLLGPITVRRL
jgi:transcriptional regulator with XRE-family HTH domain